MKTLLLKIAFITLVTIGLNGCYTVIWSPDSEFPTEDNSVSNIYYGDTYYGDYYYFYDTPWWWDYTPVVSGVARPTRDGSTQPIREQGGRTPAQRDPIVNTPPPTREINPPSTGNSGNTENKGSSTETTRSSSSNSGSSSRESSSSGSSVRNNNGGRNSGGRK